MVTNFAARTSSTHRAVFPGFYGIERLLGASKRRRRVAERASRDYESSA